ncbi:C5-sterol desaturase [Laccaria bicolor S238N-H82]|uniref:C5-sterol desaturase n=1 Tax=Laccaria bicolor (strain S238N-H82 / ATCC MYA-4686) TaxID=486041 RepID=B0DA59_LACBS|nr:C5-sterol desaturase [Laccaria bicolor S238N-H82]EDR08702.1 C5-sterol desaturase [Laccaria bicolor S238N-H82]|eukprot:XP_001880927.1 C5-sterol desaturase [Laccaria bicolor S238N-H82]
MDLVLKIADDFVFDRVYAALIPLDAFTRLHGASYAANATSKFGTVSLPASWTQLISYLPHPPVSAANITPPYTLPQISAWPREYIPRQLATLIVITLIGIHILYFLFAWVSYQFIFNHDMMRHPRFLKNQVKLEIQTSLRAFPMMTLLTLPWFQAEVMGYSKLYDGIDTYGYFYLFASVPFFLLFTDYGIYWVHRGLHHPVIYRMIHKPHHKWLIPTPFASHAFHPVDGYLQSVPYHLFIFLFPLHRLLYLGLFVAVNFWSIFIHDSDMITGHAFEKVINGPAHHTLHHLYFTVNYGQYFTWADRVGGSYRQPESSLDPLLDIPDLKKE